MVLSVILSMEAWRIPVKKLATSAGLAPAPAELLRYRAAAPATCGAAIEVPLIVLVASGEVYHAEVIEEPGARMSTQRPVLE
jgi:hypothetical protein